MDVEYFIVGPIQHKAGCLTAHNC